MSLKTGAESAVMIDANRINVHNIIRIRAVGDSTHTFWQVLHIIKNPLQQTQSIYLSDESINQYRDCNVSHLVVLDRFE
jgi:hypothetical protein